MLVPTHDHGTTLDFSLASALAQEVEDIEVLVVGDGAPASTRALVEAIAARDPRVRYFDNPKGAGHGEMHRHHALQTADGAVVAYLSDDDLWHPGHLTELLALLEEADFANTLPVAVTADGSLRTWAVDLSLEADRRLLLRGENRVPLSFAGHTMALYRRLPEGWQPRPQGVPSDLNFFRQCLTVEGCRARSGMRPTGLHLASVERRDAGPQERHGELRAWSERVQSEWPAVVMEILAEVAADRARFGAEWRGRADAVAELEVIRGTATWRLRERFARGRVAALARAALARLGGARRP